MAGSFNKVILMGNLTRDPETRVTPSGMTICKLGLAVNRTFSTKEGDKREEVTFIDCDAFGKQAEVISKYMSKGRSILIEGRLRMDEWESQGGDKRSKLVVVVENFQFAGGRGEGESGNSDYEQSSPPRRQTSAAASKPQNENLDDDVPF